MTNTPATTATVHLELLGPFRLRTGDRDPVEVEPQMARVLGALALAPGPVDKRAIAATLGISVRTVETVLSRATRLLDLAPGERLHRRYGRSGLVSLDTERVGTDLERFRRLAEAALRTGGTAREQHRSLVAADSLVRGGLADGLDLVGDLSSSNVPTVFAQEMEVARSHFTSLHHEVVRVASRLMAMTDSIDQDLVRRWSEIFADDGVVRFVRCRMTLESDAAASMALVESWPGGPEGERLRVWARSMVLESVSTGAPAAGGTSEPTVDPSPLVGRDDPLRDVMSLLDASIGTAQSVGVSIEGPAGTGKTALVDELLRRNGSNWSHVVRVDGETTPTLMGVFRAVLRPLVSVLRRRPDPVDAFLPGSPFDAVLTDVEASAVGMRFDHGGVDRLDFLVAAMNAALVALRGEPVLIVVENAHRCGPIVDEWLERLLRSSPVTGRPALAAVVVRRSADVSDAAVVRSGGPTWATIALGPLADSDIRTILRHRDPHGFAPADGIVERIVRQASGIPGVALWLQSSGLPSDTDPTSIGSSNTATAGSANDVHSPGSASSDPSLVQEFHGEAAESALRRLRTRTDKTGRAGDAAALAAHLPFVARHDLVRLAAIAELTDVADELAHGFDFEESDRLYDAVQRCTSGLELAAVHLRRAKVLRWSARWSEAAASVSEAADLAAASGDIRLEALAALEMAHVTWDPTTFGPALQTRLQRVLAALPEPDRVLRARLGACLAGGLYQDGVAGSGPGSAALARSALAVLVEADGTIGGSARCEILMWSRKALLDIEPPEYCAGLAADLLASADGSDFFRGHGLLACVVDALRMNRLGDVYRGVDRYREVATGTGSPLQLYVSATLDTIGHGLRGEHGPMRTSIERASSLAEFGGVTAQQVIGAQMIWLASETGTLRPHHVDAAVALSERVGQRQPIWPMAAAWISAQIGELEEARRRFLAATSVADFRLLQPGPFRIGVLALAVETLFLCQVDRFDGQFVPIATALLDEVSRLPERGVLIGWPAMFLGPVERLRAMAALGAGELDVAEIEMTAALRAAAESPAFERRGVRELAVVRDVKASPKR